MHRLLLVFLICAGIGIGCAYGKPTKPPASTSTNAKATALLENAKWYLDAKDYVSAQKSILEALGASPDDKQTRDQARLLWEQVQKASQEKQATDLQKTRNKLAAQLEEAKRLSAQGKNDQASQTALSVLKESDDPQLVAEAKSILANNQPSAVGLVRVLPQRLFVIGGWALDILLAMLLVFVPLLLFRRLRSLYKRYSWGKAYQGWRESSSKNSKSFFRYLKDEGGKYRWWAFQGVDDTTKTGVAEAVIDSIKRMGETPQIGYADLLQMERMKFQPLLFEFSEVHVDLFPALESLNLQIGGVTLGGIAKAWPTLRAWFDAKLLWIKGTVTAADQLITLRLTRRNADDTSFTVTASADKTKISELAEAATYMMYYSLVKESSLSKVEAANKLREGKKLLEQYVSGQDPKQLEAARDVFRNLRIEEPTFSEVYLYEGIALDLLEEHEEAIKRFQYLKNNLTKPADRDLKNKAIYNEAVALFRTYGLKEFKGSIAILDGLIGLAPDQTLAGALAAVYENLRSDPLKTLALATKANVIAHLSIYWRDYCPVPKDPEDQEFPSKKAIARKQIDDWVEDVKTISDCLEEVLKNPKGDSWDDATKQEVRWAIQNAYGNVNLNSAINFFVPPNSVGDEPQKRSAYLKDAYKYFQECEMLLPPGVETLTNLATVVLELSREDKNYRYDQVRAYLTRAKAANPHYEYADYRLAESWEQEGRIDEVVRVLRSFAKDRTPTISSFKEFYSRYSLQLAKFPVEPLESPESEIPSAKPASQSA